MRWLIVVLVLLLLAVSCSDEESTTAPENEVNGLYRVFADPIENTCRDVQGSEGYLMQLRVEGDHCYMTGIESKWDPTTLSASMVNDTCTIEIEFIFAPYVFVGRHDDIRPSAGCATEWALTGIRVVQ